jgi:hypothetical protein
MDDWVRAASEHGAFLASALDLRVHAEHLVAHRLARCDGRVEIDPRLEAIGQVPDAAALRAVARLLLSVDPPVWLKFAVSTSKVIREYIPREDYLDLAWLEPELEEVLIGAHLDSVSHADDDWRKRMGDAAELLVLDGLRRRGFQASHVARISDAYGYDIDVRHPFRLRIEVKACGPQTAGTFFLTRHEFETSQLHREEWLLRQVVFSSSAFTAWELGRSHVAGIYDLNPAALSAAVPPDTSEFSWRDTAQVTPPADAWLACPHSLDSRTRVPGFGVDRSRIGK